MSKKWTKWELVLVMREHVLRNQYTPPDKNQLHEAVHTVSGLFSQMSSPQLCFPYELLDDISKREVMMSGDWVFEKKLNGYRCMATVVNGQVWFWSRTLDAVNFLPFWMSPRIAMDIPKIGLPNCIIDGELVAENIPDSFRSQDDYLFFIFNEKEDIRSVQKIQEQYPLTWYPFDIPYFDGTWVSDLPLYERSHLLDHVMDALDHPQVGRIDRVLRNRGEFLSSIIRHGGEGVVAKNIHGTYDRWGKRNKNSYIKIKRSYSLNPEVMNIKDTYDGWISGFDRLPSGVIKTIDVSAYLPDNQPVVIAKVNVPFSQQQPFTTFTEEGMKQEPILGMVVEVDGRGFDDNHRLIDPVLVRFRLDKTIDSCVLLQ